MTTGRSPSAHAPPCQSAPTHLSSRHGADAQPGAEQASGSRNGVAFSRYHLKTAEHGGSDVRKPARGEAPGPACPRPPQVSRQTGGNDRGGPGSRSKVRGHAARARGSESHTRRGRKLDGTSLVLVPHLPRHRTVQPGGRGLLPVPFLRTQLLRGPRLPGSGLSVSSRRDWRRSGRTRGSDGDGQGAPWETVGGTAALTSCTGTAAMRGAWGREIAGGRMRQST